MCAFMVTDSILRVAQCYGKCNVTGGNIGLGLEDTLWLDKGVLGANAQLVGRAVTVIEGLAARVLGPAEVRKKLDLTKRARFWPEEEHPCRSARRLRSAAAPETLARAKQFYA